jgi:hypothetical protein
MFMTRVVEKIKTRFLFINFFFENRNVFYLRRNNFIELDRPQMTIRRMLIACWISKATKTHSDYVILIVFLLQQWLHERTLMLHSTHIASLV